MRTPDELDALFRASGRKVTPQRQRIFRALHGNATHPTAEAVYAEVVADMPAISLKTVYQTLHDLAALGEVELLDLGTGATRVDPNNDGAHHHLVCDECASVRDLVRRGRRSGAPVRGPVRASSCGRTEIVFRGLCARLRPRRRPVRA